MQYTVSRGTKGKKVRFMMTAQGSGVNGPLLGLTPGSSDLSAGFIREGDAAATAIPLTNAEGSAHTPGAFREIDGELMPGLYELHVPDEVFSGPAESAVIMINAPNAEPAVVHVDVVAYDPYDGERLGLSCLSQESRHACLASAFGEVLPTIVAQREARDGT